MGGWIAVDLDGTLARYEGWKNGEIGEPIPAMVERVRHWLFEGKEVRIFTARVGIQPGAYSLESKRFADAEFVAEETAKVQDWCEKYIGTRLPVTNVKDFSCIEIWDDRAVQVIPNTGKPVTNFVVNENTQNALKLILSERERQNKKWGEQNHSDEIWLPILTEELGEVSKAMLETRFGGGYRESVREELTHVAAVALQWLECMERNGI